MRFAWIDERPFGYPADGGPQGCDLALVRAAARHLSIDVSFERTTFDQLLPGLAAGRWDVTTGMFITARRRRDAAFTRPIWSLADGLLLPAGTAVRGYADIAAAGARLAVLRGQVQAEHAVALGVDPGHLLVLEEYDQARDAVLTGRAAGYASVALAHEQHLRAHPDDRLVCARVPGGEVPPAPGGFACADPGLRDALDEALDAVLGHTPLNEPSSDPADWPC